MSSVFSKAFARQVAVRLKPVMAVQFAALAFMLASTSAAANQASWPEPRLPDDLTTFAMGQAMTIDGLPMRMQGFVSRLGPAVLAEAMRHSLGQPLVETVQGNRRILGRGEGHFYLTVQIEASGNGSKGVIASADLDALARNRHAIERTKAQWLERLPAGSTIASDMRSEDGGRQARHTVILNEHGPELNRDAIVRLLAGEGYVLEREAGQAGAAPASAAQHSADATTLHFSAPGKEAMAVIARSGTRTAIVLNTVSILKGTR